MKKFGFLLVSCVVAGIIFSACKSVPSQEENVTIEQPKPSQAENVQEVVKIPAPKPEPVDPPNVAFAKKLRKELKENNIKGAIELFAELPEELADDLELKMLLASLYYSDTQFDKAIVVANEVLAVEPSNMDALELISLCNHASGDKAAYKASADKILAVDPYNAAINIQKAEDYAINKKYKLARDSYKQALKGDPKNTDALFGYAQMSYYLNDVKTASTTFQKILDIDDSNAPALAYMGKIQAESENYLRAAKFVKDALENDPHNYDYWMDYGTYLRFQGKFAEAEAAWKHAASLDPTYFLAYAYLAGNYDDRNMYEEALENYRMVIKTNPKYYFAYEETALLEYHMGNYENAIKYFLKALEYSENYSYRLMIYACYWKLGNSFKAKEILAPAMKTLDKNSIEYAMVRFYNDTLTKNAETSLTSKISKEDNSTKRGKMLFYMGLYYELNNFEQLANDYYSKVTAMQAPMFFEYRIAEWSLGL